MLVRVLILGCVGMVILAGVWLGKESLGQDPAGQPQQVAKDAAATVAPAASADAKPAAAAVSAGKDVPLASLAQVIELVEKTGRGPVVRAEKLGEGGKQQFNVDVVVKDGSQKRFNVDATGKVIVESAEPARGFSSPSAGRKGSGERSRKEGRPEGERKREKERERRDDD